MNILLNLKNNFSVDLRSLAITRIVFSLLIFIDLLIRSQYLEEYFTDSGIMPLRALRVLYPSNYQNSLHALSGDYTFELFLFLLAVLFAFLLLIGLFTRIATILSWALLVSLNLRNPLILQGGDTLFKCLMFWAIFMPWGERFSVDSYLNKKSESKYFVFSIGAMAFIIQIMFLYFFSATLKKGKLWTEDYTAIYYALSIGHFNYFLGSYLYKFPYLMKFVTFFVYWLEYLGPFLLLIPYKNGFFRYLFIILIGFFQIGLALTMRLGLFPWFALTAMLILLPSSFWGFFPRIEEKLNLIFSRLSNGLRSIYGDIDELIYFKIKWPKRINVFISIFIAVLIIYVLLWNIRNTYELRFEFVNNISNIGNTLQINQKWNMFAPQPYRNDGWFVIVGHLENGKLVDVFRNGKKVIWDPPLNRNADYPSYRWRKFMRNVSKKKNIRYRKYYAKYVCNKWNESGDMPKLIDINVYFVIERNLPDYKVKKPKIKNLYAYNCLTSKRKK